MASFSPGCDIQNLFQVGFSSSFGRIHHSSCLSQFPMGAEGPSGVTIIPCKILSCREPLPRPNWKPLVPPRALILYRQVCLDHLRQPAKFGPRWVPHKVHLENAPLPGFCLLPSSFRLHIPRWEVLLPCWEEKFAGRGLGAALPI